MTKYNISKSELFQLYILENKRVKEVAKHFNCSYHTILFYIRKYNIKKDRKSVGKLIGDTLEERTGYRTPIQNLETRIKIENTNLKKTGYAYNLQNPKCHELAKQTSIKRYGVDNPAKSKQVQEKIEKTNLERYGVKNVLQNKEIRNKCKNTLREKTGYEYATQNPETRKKVEQTCLKKYGVKNASQNKEIKEKSKRVNLEHYGIEIPMQLDVFKEKVKVTKLERYGDENYNNKEKIKQTSLERYGYENPMQDPRIIEKVWATKKARGNTNTSKSEDKIAEIIRKSYPDMLRNHSTNLYPFACDFYIPSQDLYIEYQGHQSHNKEPYDASNPEHQQIIEMWRARAEQKRAEGKKYTQYDTYISIWTQRDPKKRQVAAENHLNWHEFFTFDAFCDWWYKHSFIQEKFENGDV